MAEIENKWSNSCEINLTAKTPVTLSVNNIEVMHTREKEQFFFHCMYHYVVHKINDEILHIEI